MRMRKRLELRKVKQQKKANIKLQKMITQKMMADYQRRLRLQELDENKQREPETVEPTKVDVIEAKTNAIGSSGEVMV